MDLQEDVAVSKVVIYNRKDCGPCKQRLSAALVSLLNMYDKKIKLYILRNMFEKSKVELLISNFTPLARKIKFSWILLQSTSVLLS